MSGEEERGEGCGGGGEEVLRLQTKQVKIGRRINQRGWINQRGQVIISYVLLFYPNIVVKLPYLQHPPSTFSYHFYSICLPRIMLLSAFPPLDSPVWQKHPIGNSLYSIQVFRSSCGFFSLCRSFETSTSSCYLSKGFSN